MIFLDDHEDFFLLRVWSGSRVPAGFAMTISSREVFAYADKYHIDRIELLELIRHIEQEAVRGKDT